MSRRRTSRPDSLELLLDTICNTFGGVLFIAILVVLLLQQAGVGPASSATIQTPHSPTDIERMTKRLENVDAELDRLRKNRDSQDTIVQTFAPDEIRELLVRRGRIVAQQEKLESGIDQSVVSNTSRAAEIETLSDEHKRVTAQLLEARRRQQTERESLEDEQRSRVEQVRMPVIHDNDGLKSEIALIIRYGRLYRWHDYDEFSIRRGLNTRDFVVTGEEFGALVVRPNPARGIAIDGSEESKRAIRELLQPFDPKSNYLGIVVRSDSHGAFRHVRDVAIETGFEYHMVPAAANKPIVDRGGAGGRVQ